MLAVGALVAIVVLSVIVVALAIGWGVTGSRECSSSGTVVERSLQSSSVKARIWDVARGQVLLANVRSGTAPPGPHLSWFRLARTDNAWVVQGTSRKPPDDAGGFRRLTTVRDFLTRNVLPKLNDVPEGLEGYYVVETNDCGVDAHPEYTTFCYSQRATIRGSLTMPDMYNMMGHPDIQAAGLTDHNLCANRPWAQRQAKIVFVGSDTGPSDLATNRRLLYCRWANTRPELAYCKITRLAQFPPGSVPAELLGPEMPVREQLNYRYVLSVDGNAASWGRVPATLEGCSVLFKDTVPDQEQLWYYPFMIPDQHFVEVNLHTIEQEFRRVESDEALQQTLHREGKRFVQDFMSEDATTWWLEALLRNVAYQRRAVGL